MGLIKRNPSVMRFKLVWVGMDLKIYESAIPYFTSLMAYKNYERLCEIAGKVADSYKAAK